MNTITVNASSEYRVVIGNGLLGDLGAYAAKVSRGQKVAIVSDSNVWSLYGSKAEISLSHAGFQVCSYVFPAGEKSKNGANLLNILNFLAENQLNRDDLMIALGGGVVGDITGFAAAVYLRGIPYMQVPTTLLAMVDSSVGGKTAIDLPAGKNLAGAFYQPCLVVCDTSLLDTLPENVFRDGCAEVIKYGVLFDPALFVHLTERGPSFDREWVISRCIALKRDVVIADEFDRGDRQKLNLGHTIGHSIEKCSNYAVSHGNAVAAGIAIVSRAAVKFGFCPESVSDSIIKTLHIFRLPTATDYDADNLSHYAYSDKKRVRNTVNLIIPQTIGRCMIYPMPVAELKSFIEAGM